MFKNCLKRAWKHLSITNVTFMLSWFCQTIHQLLTFEDLLLLRTWETTVSPKLVLTQNEQITRQMTSKSDFIFSLLYGRVWLFQYKIDISSGTENNWLLNCCCLRFYNHISRKFNRCLCQIMSKSYVFPQLAFWIISDRIKQILHLYLSKKEYGDANIGFHASYVKRSCFEFLTFFAFSSLKNLLKKVVNILMELAVFLR